MDNNENLIGHFIIIQLLVSSFILLFIALYFYCLRRRRLLLIRQGLEECPICKVAIENPDELHVTPCGHSFHDACLQDWLNIRPVCPMCRELLP